jgi:hypothetical protein
MPVLAVVAVLVALVALLVCGPLLLIWSVNTLFGLTIAYTFKTWLAMALLSSVFSARIVTSKS